MEKGHTITDIQLAYLVGRDKDMYLGGNSTHCYLEYEGSAGPEAVEEAFNKVIRSHTALRLTVHRNGTQEVINDPPRYRIVCDDLSMLDDVEKTAHIEGYRASYSHRIHELGTYPMFSLHAFCTAKDTYVYAFEADLMIMDRSSFEIVFSELEKCMDDPSYVPEHRGKSFIDYAERRAAFKEERCEEDRKYWENYFSQNGIPQPCDIPLHSSIGTASGHRFVSTELSVPAAEWEGVKEKLYDRHIVPSVFLLVCYARALSRWQNVPHTAVNMTTALRNVCGEIYSGNVGDFTELMIIDIDFERYSDIYAAAKAVQRTIAEHSEHLGFGGISVIKYIAEKLEKNSTALFPYAFTSSIGGAESCIGRNVLGKNVYRITQTPQVITDCQVSESGGELHICIDHPEGVAIESAVKGIAEYMSRLLLDDDTSAYCEKQIRYNETAIPLTEKTIQQAFKETAARLPEKNAVICGGESVTFSELDRLSDRYAAYIADSVGCGRRVAVEASRTIDTVAAILGVLKTGGCYIPVEPKWPSERKKYVLEAGESCLFIDGNTSLEEYPYAPFEIAGSFEDEAYIIFTSGSTGKPKGVVITQRGACNTVYDINRRFSVSDKDVLAGISSFCFDLSVYDLFGCFSTGGTLLLCGDMQKMPEEVIRYKATIWNTVPAIMGIFLGRADKRCSLRTILLSGDWIPLDMKEKITEMLPNADMISLGGATEGSVWSIYYPVKEVRPEWKSIPYGYPLSNQTMWILGYDDEICPIGVEGEICIGGMGVAVEYAGAPEKTKEQFFIHDKLGKLYRTGDYGVFTDDGYIVFLGRRDQQIKLHGYRIELGEIESVITASEKVAKAAVRVVNSGNGTSHLLAYAVPEMSGEITVSDKLYGSAAEAASQAAEAIPVNFDAARFTEVMKLYEDTAAALIANEFACLGVLSCEGTDVSADKLIGEGHIAEKYRKLIEQWISVMLRKGYMYTDAAGNVRSAKKCRYTAPEDILAPVYALDSRSDMRNYKEFFIGTGLRISELLTDKVNALEVMFSDGSPAFMENMYQNSISARYMNNILAEAVCRYAKAKKTGTIRILEAGAGVGGTTYDTLRKLSALEGVDIEYHYTDLSDFFFGICKDKFGGYDCMRYSIYDLDVHPEIQGFTAGSFDIVICANCLHDAAFIDRAVGDLRTLLKNDGMLAVLELTSNLVQYKTTIGFVGGFLGYKDDRLGVNEILLSETQWKEAALRNGFSPFFIR